MADLFDVLSVRLASRRVGLIARNKSEAESETIITKCVKRFGSADEFFAKAAAGAYRDNDPWKGPDWKRITELEEVTHNG